MVFIYALKLENSKYYIGKTTNPKIRLDNHFDLNGSKWTQKYTPLNIQEIIPDCEDFDEDKYTLKYMNKYGIDNGSNGDLVVLQCKDSIEAIRLKPARLFVVRRGKVISSTKPIKYEINLASKTEREDLLFKG